MINPINIISKQECPKNNQKLRQEKVWDKIEFSQKPSKIIENFLNGKKGKIVDFGCGNGRNMIPNKEIEYYGVDFSEGQLKNAGGYIQENAINAKLFKSKLDKLDKNIFQDKMFDYGLFIGSLHCLETPEDRLKVLKEFYRILKTGGEALISVWNSDDPRFKCMKGDIYMSWKKEEINYMRYYYLYSKSKFLVLLKKVGFKVLEFYKPLEHDRFSKKNWIVRVVK